MGTTGRREENENAKAEVGGEGMTLTLPVSRQTGGTLSGIDIDNSAELLDIMDVDNLVEEPAISR
jgi:hypothetical protein